MGSIGPYKSRMWDPKKRMSLLASKYLKGGLVTEEI